MTDGLDVALANAGLALLQADVGPPALVVFDGVVPAGTSVNAGYVLVYSTVDRPSEAEDNPLNGQSRTWVARWILHNVGGTALAARGVAQRSRTALLDVRPTVTGLSCGLIRWESTTPPQRDETTGSPVFDLVETFRLNATS